MVLWWRQFEPAVESVTFNFYSPKSERCSNIRPTPDDSAPPPFFLKLTLAWPCQQPCPCSLLPRNRMTAALIPSGLIFCQITFDPPRRAEASAVTHWERGRHAALWEWTVLPSATAHDFPICRLHRGTLLRLFRPQIRNASGQTDDTRRCACVCVCFKQPKEECLLKHKSWNNSLLLLNYALRLMKYDTFCLGVSFSCILLINYESEWSIHIKYSFQWLMRISLNALNVFFIYLFFFQSHFILSGEMLAKGAQLPSCSFSVQLFVRTPIMPKKKSLPFER